MDVQQLRKRLKKRAERARVARAEQECLICKKNRAPLLNGAARVFDLGATFSTRSCSADPKLEWASALLDAYALRSDWERAGSFMWEGLDNVTDGLDDETLLRILNEWSALENSERDSLSASKRKPDSHSRAVMPAHHG
jgi:hypothetical protein